MELTRMPHRLARRERGGTRGRDNLKMRGAAAGVNQSGGRCQSERVGDPLRDQFTSPSGSDTVSGRPTGPESVQ